MMQKRPAVEPKIAESPAMATHSSAASSPAVSTPVSASFITPTATTSQTASGASSSQITSVGPQGRRLLDEIYEETHEIPTEYSGLCLLAAEEPNSVKEAFCSANWKKAMEMEMKSIHENKTWVLATLPKGQKAIGLKWVFKVKKDSEGKIVKYKARLVAKGYAQRHGVDFDEVFTPVARMETVRVLIALAAQGRWEIHHMDVKSAFLNVELAEEVYVQQPPGFVEGTDEHQVLKLEKHSMGCGKRLEHGTSSCMKHLCQLEWWSKGAGYTGSVGRKTSGRSRGAVPGVTVAMMGQAEAAACLVSRWGGGGGWELGMDN